MYSNDCAQASTSYADEEADISITEHNVSHTMSDDYSDFNISLDSHCTNSSQEESTILKR